MMRSNLRFLRTSKKWRPVQCASLSKYSISVSLLGSIDGPGAGVHTDLAHSPTSKIRSKHQFEEPKLIQYLQAAGALSCNDSNFIFSQFSHGQSNPTFVLGCDTTSEGGVATKRKIVIRKQPPGKLLKGTAPILLKAESCSVGLNLFPDLAVVPSICLRLITALSAPSSSAPTSAHLFLTISFIRSYPSHLSSFRYLPSSYLLFVVF